MFILCPVTQLDIQCGKQCHLLLHIHLYFAMNIGFQARSLYVCCVILKINRWHYSRKRMRLLHCCVYLENSYVGWEGNCSKAVGFGLLCAVLGFASV